VFDETSINAYIVLTSMLIHNAMAGLVTAVYV